MDKAHIVKTTHHDTGRIVLFCGEERDAPEEPSQDAVPCTDCLLAAMNAIRRQHSKDLKRLVASMIEDMSTAYRKIDERHTALLQRVSRIEGALSKKARKRLWGA